MDSYNSGYPSIAGSSDIQYVSPSSPSLCIPYHRFEQTIDTDVNIQPRMRGVMKLRVMIVGALEIPACEEVVNDNLEIMGESVKEIQFIDSTTCAIIYDKEHPDAGNTAT